MLQQALNLHAAGLCVIPLRERSKQPAMAWKAYQKRRPGEDELHRWFAHGEHNLAVVCGQVSAPQGLSLVVLDFDRPGFDGWAAGRTEIAGHTWLSASGRGEGRHLWLLVPGQVNGTTFDFGEVKGEGGYVVTPPSIHPNGQPYRWLRRQGDLLVVEDLQRLDLGIQGRDPQPVRETLPALAAVDEEVVQQILGLATQRASNGSRNHSGFWLAAQLRDNGLPPEQARRVLFDYQQAVANWGDHPYTLQEAWLSLRSAYASPPRQPWRAYRQ